MVDVQSSGEEVTAMPMEDKAAVSEAEAAAPTEADKVAVGKAMAASRAPQEVHKVAGEMRDNVATPKDDIKNPVPNLI